jgi:transcriptional regulator GlxA family with amidase domain
MRQCLLLILRSHFERLGLDSPIFAPLRDPRLVRAVTAILIGPGAQHTLRSLAEEAGMSRSAFSQRFAESFGQTPFEFLQKVRLRHAAHVLCVTDLPVKMIAEVAGFSSRSHFSRTFREAFGADPTRYREMRGVSEGLSVPVRTPPEEEVS